MHPESFPGVLPQQLIVLLPAAWHWTKDPRFVPAMTSQRHLLGALKAGTLVTAELHRQFAITMQCASPPSWQFPLHHHRLQHNWQNGLLACRHPILLVHSANCLQACVDRGNRHLSSLYECKVKH